jgi:hypothetical protein
MDCEGCEYESILSAREDTLRKFRYMQIEYHYGYKDLKNKLEKRGYQRSTHRPKQSYCADNNFYYLSQNNNAIAQLYLKFEYQNRFL